MEAASKLLELKPSNGVLRFELRRGNVGPSTSVLNLTNTSGKRLAFKIKTTMPQWFLVRPSQELLDVDESVDVSIELIEAEVANLLEAGPNNNENERGAKFMVQSKIIDDEEYARIRQVAATARQPEYEKLWYTSNGNGSSSSGSSAKQNTKMSVEYIFPPSVSTSNTSSSSSGRSSSNNDQGNNTKANNKMSVGALRVELQNLQSKYNQVMEYTAHLIAERDMLGSRLEVLQGNKEQLKKVHEEKYGRGLGGGGKKKGLSSNDFTLFTVLFVAFCAFACGKYIRISSS